MIIASVIGILIAIAIVTLYEWPKMELKKDKVAYIVLTAAGFILSIILLINPEIAGPTDLVDYLYKPFHEWMAKGS